MRSSILAAVVATLLVGSADASDWITSRSTFTHDPRTDERVNQYSPVGPVYAYPARTQSAYRHIRSVIRAGDTADFLHIVEQFGPNVVRPYGEWQFPFRPYSVPYSLWGPPVFLGYPFPPFPFPPFPPTPYPLPGPYGDGGAEPPGGGGYPGHGYLPGHGFPGHGYPGGGYPGGGYPGTGYMPGHGYPGGGNPGGGYPGGGMPPGAWE